MLTIGGFSTLGNVSRRMLRHYDEIGLLRPAYIAENGYRYYDDAQLSVLRQIETLKQYGFQLAEIKELLPLPEEELAQHIHEKRLAAHDQLHQMRKTLRLMEEDIMRMERTGIMTDKYHIILMDAPEQHVFCLRRTIDISQTHQLFQDLKDEMEKSGLKRAGVTQQVFMGDTFSYEALDIEAQIEVHGEGENGKTIPPQTYAATTHIGPYESLHYAYEALGVV